MGMNAKASLFYGVMLNKSDYEKLAKKLNINTGDDYDDDYEKIELITRTMGFYIVWCTQEFSDKEQYGIAVYEKTVYDYDDDRAFKIPSETTLNEKWEKLNKTLKLSKKPGWHLFTEHS